MLGIVKTINFWIDSIFYKKYPNVGFGIIYNLYIRATPMWRSYDPEYDSIIEKILDNIDSIDHLDANKNKNELTIVYKDGKRISLYIPSSLGSFLENICLYDKHENRIHGLFTGRPSRQAMIKFIDKFSEFLKIRKGKVDFNLMTTDRLEDYFDFGDKKDDKKSDG